MEDHSLVLEDAFRAFDWVPMLQLTRGDDKLVTLVGATIASQHEDGVRYEIHAPLGFGSVAVAFFGLRITRDGSVPVVVKVLRPSFVRQFGPMARLTIEREVIALRRLNEQVPPNPFVVRLLDDGTTTALLKNEALELPWIVIEYVHGGAHGTTLAQRVENAIGTTGHAFGPGRVAHAVDCLTLALEAVHDVGVIHRGLTPNNVLCSGFADDEVFKIADFGVARPVGWSGTLSGLPIGTPGFTAPELLGENTDEIGPWSDTFALGSLIFYMLTGEPYFPSHTMEAAIEAARAPARRSIRDAAGLSPELREREPACRAIDFVLGWATASEPTNRLAEVHALSAMIATHFRTESMRPAFAIAPEPTFDGGSRADLWSWRPMRRRGQIGVIRSVAWDGSGGCLAATSEGLWFWDGTSWSAADTRGVPDPTGVRFVRRIGPGRWLLGGDASMLAIYTTGGVTRIVQAPAQSARFEQLSGDLDDIALLVSTPAGGTPTLNTFIGKRWLRPLALTEIAALAGAAQVDDSRWLLAGRSVDGKSYAALFSPLDFRTERLATPEKGAFTACTGQPRLATALAVGSAGMVLWHDGERARMETIEGGPALSAARIDSGGRGWVASAGGVWLREKTGSSVAAGAAWQRVWTDDEQVAPVVSLFAEEGRVMAITADGGMIEGRSELDEEARASSRRFV